MSDINNYNLKINGRSTIPGSDIRVPKMTLVANQDCQCFDPDVSLGSVESKTSQTSIAIDI
jgi:hypothetical protein